jgi:hypothetical protein
MNRMIAIAEVAEINPSLSEPIADDTLCSFIPMDAVDEVTADITDVSPILHPAMSRVPG